MTLESRSGLVPKSSTEQPQRARLHVSTPFRGVSGTRQVLFFGVARRSALEQTASIRNSNDPDRILVAELSVLGRIHQDPDLLFFQYRSPGHPNREWWRLDPRNRGRPRLATFRIVRHQWNAIWRGDHNVFENVVMTMDLLIASLITRTSGKARAIKKQLKLRKS